MVEFIVLGKGETLSWQSKHTVGGSGIRSGDKKREKVGSEKNRGRKGEMGAGRGEERERDKRVTHRKKERNRESESET